MKSKYIFPILFIHLTFNTLAQGFRAKELEPIDTTKWICNYNYEFYRDSTSKYSLKNDQMVLQIGSHLSKFSCIMNVIMDSVLYLAQQKNLATGAFLDLTSKSISGVNSDMMSMYNIYKNYPEKGMMITTDYDDHKFYKIKQPMQMNWRLDLQKDTVILGYACHRATTSYAGRNYLAWYSPQIPISEGPYKFNGLPGLILKVSDTKNQHCFTLNSIKKISNQQSINLRIGSFVEITTEDYVKIMRNKMVRLYGTLQSGAVTFDSEETKAKSLHGLKLRNNFIEKF